MLVIGIPTSIVQMKNMSVHKAIIMNQDPCLVTSCWFFFFYFYFYL